VCVCGAGEIDPFLKIPRPDGQPDKLGLTMLDEPAVRGVDMAVKMVVKMVG